MTEIKYVLLCKDGYDRPRTDPHSGGRIAKLIFHAPKRTMIRGHPFVLLGYGKREMPYSLEGRIRRYHYRLLRNLFHTEYTGNRMYWKEGNPTPIDFDDKKWKDALDDTGHILQQINDGTSLETLARPRRQDFVLIIAAAVIGLLMGAVIVMAYKGG